MPISVHEYKALYLKTSMQCVAAIRASLARYGTAECDVDTHVTECHRMAHSLKSQSLVMGYTQIGLAARMLESLFLHVSRHELHLTDQIVGDIWKMIDGIESAIARISRHEGEGSLAQLTQQLEDHTSIRLLP